MLSFYLLVIPYKPNKLAFTLISNTYISVYIYYYLQSTQNQSQQQALLNKSNDDLRRKRPETTRPNHILLFTIINPFYPITVVSTHKNYYIYTMYINFNFIYYISIHLLLLLSPLLLLIPSLSLKAHNLLCIPCNHRV